MKRLLAFLLFGGVIWAATTTVTQTVTGPDGNPASGTALIRISAPCVAGTTYVGDRTIAVRFTAGNFSTTLVPNDACVNVATNAADTTYSVTWTLTGGTTSKPQTWLVPTSGTPLTVGAVTVVCSGSSCTGTGSTIIWMLPVSVAVNAASYSDGFMSLTTGSTSVVGTNTTWTSAMTGRWLYTLPCMGIYKFTFVDATDGTLDRPYACATTNGNGTRYTLTQSTYVAGGIGRTGVIVQCYDAQVPATRMGPANVLVYANYDVEILWRLAKVGYCVLSP